MLVLLWGHSHPSLFCREGYGFQQILQIHLLSSLRPLKLSWQPQGKIAIYETAFCWKALKWHCGNSCNLATEEHFVLADVLMGRITFSSSSHHRSFMRPVEYRPRDQPFNFPWCSEHKVSVFEKGVQKDRSRSLQTELQPQDSVNMIKWLIHGQSKKVLVFTHTTAGGMLKAIGHSCNYFFILFLFWCAVD